MPRKQANVESHQSAVFTHLLSQEHHLKLMWIGSRQLKIESFDRRIAQIMRWAHACSLSLLFILSALWYSRIHLREILTFFHSCKRPALESMHVIKHHRFSLFFCPIPLLFYHHHPPPPLPIHLLSYAHETCIPRWKGRGEEELKEKWEGNERNGAIKRREDGVPLISPWLWKKISEYPEKPSSSSLFSFPIVIPRKE